MMMVEEDRPWGEGTASREELVPWLKSDKSRTALDVGIALVEIFMTVANEQCGYANPTGGTDIILDGSYDMEKIAQLLIDGGFVT